MSIVAKKICNFKINDKEVTAPEGMPILDAAQRNGFQITNLCFNRKLKPFAACRTCMVEVKDDGKKELVYSCTHPVTDGIEVQINTEETDRYNNACLELLLVEHPLDCPICDKSGICPLQDNTEAMGIYDGRFEIKRRNEPSIKTNPIIEFYLNRCIMCGMCVRVCDETQGVQALDFHRRGYGVVIGTANEEPLDCEFCGQCITVCPTGALNDLTSQARGLAALFKNTYSTCNYCSWGCTVKLETKSGQLIRIEADETLGLGVNDGNLCAKGRFGHGFVQSEKRLKVPMANVGGSFQEITWTEAIKTIAERLQSTVNRNGPAAVAGIASEKMTNEEAYLFQKLFRQSLGSNQITNLQNVRAPYINEFMQKCFDNGIESKPVTELENSDVVLIFNSDLPSEYPVGGNAVRKGAIFTGTDVILANPRKVVFRSEAQNQLELTFSVGSDMALANRLSKIIIDKKLVDLGKAKKAVPNYDEWVKSLDACTSDQAQTHTGLDDAKLTKAAECFAKPADRYVLVGNDILENAQGEGALNALLNLCILVHAGGEGSVSVFPPREHCNSQGVNDMGLTPQYLPGYQKVDKQSSAALAKAWGMDALDLDQNNYSETLFESCISGEIKALFVSGEDPLTSYYKGSLVKEALKTIPFLIVQDSFMSPTAEMADLILPSCSYAEKDGTFTNMTRHIQTVREAVLPEGSARPEFDVFQEIAEALGKPFNTGSIEEVQKEIESVVPEYKDAFKGKGSPQWKPSKTGSNPGFTMSGDYKEPKDQKGFPFKLITNNHMFHIGNYTQHCDALTTVSGEQSVQINRKDAQAQKIENGDKVKVESKNHSTILTAEVNGVSTPGTVYISKNWVEHSVNLFRNGEEGYVPVKISKAK